MSSQNESLGDTGDATTVKDANFEPICVLEVELSSTLPFISPKDKQTGHTYGRALVLVRLHTRTVGVVELELTEAGLSAEQCAREIWRVLGNDINLHLQSDGLPEVDELGARGLVVEGPPRCVQEREQFLAHAPFVSVIVATRDRTASLRNGLDSLLALRYPAYEIIVIDNAPSSNATALLIEQHYGQAPKVRYALEDKPGLGHARNRGLLEASGSIVAFTDDDVVVDQNWLAELVRAFDSGDKVAAVTGLVFPAELETPAQVWFEQTSGWSGRLQERVYDLENNRLDTVLYPYTTGRFGAGANMAFRTSVLRRMGGFDPALGVGTPALGGEDLAAYFEVLVSKYQIVYQPSAVVHHRHRREYQALRRQVYAYGVGLTAYLTKLIFDRPWRVLDLMSRAPAGLIYGLSARSPRNAKRLVNYPRELIALERKGFLLGPFAYLRGHWRTRRLHRSMRQELARLAERTSEP